MNDASEDDPQAALISGGLDSSVLLGELVASGVAVTPIYIRTGAKWEAVELDLLARFMRRIERSNLRPLVILDVPTHDLYDDHWAAGGAVPDVPPLDVSDAAPGAVPDAAAPDEAFYIPGRNVVLLSKSLLWCRLHGVKTLSMGILAGNPFPDASETFVAEFARIVGAGTGGELNVSLPYARMSKAEVIRRGRAFPLELSLSCISPAAGRHCGVCGKCAERGRAFAVAGVPDPTEYASAFWKDARQVVGGARPWDS